MASTNEQLDEKISAIIRKINELQVTITNLAAKAQLRQLTLLIQRDLNDLKVRVTDLETEVQILKNS
jgi:hypothetical protein